MSDWLALLFLSNLVWIMVHELDAIYQGEWRFFNIPFQLEDDLAYRVFTILHVPLFIMLIWAIPSQAFQIGFDIFVIGHAMVHWLLRNHPLITFNNWFSRLLIFAPVVTSIIHLIFMIR